MWNAGKYILLALNINYNHHGDMSRKISFSFEFFEIQLQNNLNFELLKREGSKMSKIAA